VEDCDFSPAWRPLLSILPVSPLLPDSERPATFLERPPAGHELPPELGFRLAALRETFEETGVLLTRSVAGVPGLLPAALAAEWRPRVHQQPDQLLHLARQLQLVPDVWSLHEWSAWLTPTAIGGHRHDAAFFVASVPGRPDCSGDQTETAHVEWRRPADVLEEQVAGRTLLMPPQLYELSRLQRFAGWSALERFSQERARCGLRRLFPVVARLRDGARLGLLEGDDLYPSSPDTEGSRSPLELPLTLEEAESDTRYWHRSVNGQRAHCNIQLPGRQVAPVPFPAREVDML